MVKKTIQCILFLFALTFLGCGDSGPDFEAGEWKITVDFENPGMPIKMPPITYTQCLNRDNPVPKSEKPNQTCTRKEVTTKGNTVSWSVTCTNPGGEMTGEGKITYKKDTMSGAMTMNVQNTSMVSNFTGHRLGECQSP